MAPPPPPKQGKFNRFGAFVWREWDAALAIFAFLILGVASIFGPPAPRVWAPAAFFTLAALVISLNRTRGRIDALVRIQRSQNTEVSDLVDGFQRVMTQMPLRTLVQEKRVKDPFLQQPGTDLRLSGVTLKRTLEDCEATILETLARGGHVRIMMTGLTDSTKLEFPVRFHTYDLGRLTPQEVLSEHLEELSIRLKDSQSDVMQLVDAAERRRLPGTLEIGLVPIILPIGLLIISDEGGGLRLRCELYHRSSTGDQAVFYIEDGQSAPFWLDYLGKMFEEYWEFATTVVLFSDRTKQSDFTLDVDDLSTYNREIAEQDAAEAVQDATVAPDTGDDPEPEPVAP